MGETATMDEFSAGLLEDAPAEDKKAVKGKKSERKLFTIFVDEEEQQPNYITVGVNGKQYQIKRGEDVDVPAEVIEVLKNATAERLVQRTNPVTGAVESTYQKYNRIPYRIVRM